MKASELEGSVDLPGWRAVRPSICNLVQFEQVGQEILKTEPAALGILLAFRKYGKCLPELLHLLSSSRERRLPDLRLPSSLFSRRPILLRRELMRLCGAPSST